MKQQWLTYAKLLPASINKLFLFSDNKDGISLYARLCSLFNTNFSFKNTQYYCTVLNKNGIIATIATTLCLFYHHSEEKKYAHFRQ
ncbi:hypothetical protein [Proteus sp. FME41]|uniref:hypothetical protein n=1 Tax=Proteus sp. FME41 TaxID=2742608 RepID=UPI001867444A|nr:hypothetical protein [Proteus sp. FME41]